MSAAPINSRTLRHSLFEDAQALLTGTLFAALGVALFKQAGLLSGGTVGLAFVLHYAWGWPFGLMFFAINLPCYALAWRRLGPAFTVKSLVAVALLSALAEALPGWLRISAIHPVFAAVGGGLLVGAGLIMLFRHRASLGGLNVLVLWLQDRRGWRAGYVQAGLDAAILLAALPWVPAERVGMSLLGMAAMNAALAINHRPGRYVAT
ncbi:YitT family protein [Roseateles sp. BYS87W]|uniref:YitT family protein n=1 Tax=Pelomonas baiyunensis TaxID=3299026 RepID=A0ABW7GXC1_9BURK